MPSGPASATLSGSSDSEGREESLERRLADLRRVLDRDPQNLDAWLEWAEISDRAGGSPSASTAEGGIAPPQAIRLELWRRALSNRSLVPMVLRLFGLEVPSQGQPEIGRFWRSHHRLREVDGIAFDRQTGFPLVTRRIRDGAWMQLVPNGVFWSIQVGREPRRHNLATYLCDRFPITVGQYARFLADLPPTQRLHHAPPHWDRQLDWSSRPVVFVNQDDIQAYAQWSGARVLGAFGWEKACWGMDARLLPQPAGVPWSRVANIHDPRSGPRPDPEDWEQFLEPVGVRPDGVSGYGVEDLAGNIREWCGSLASGRNPGASYRGSRYWHVRGASFSSSIEEDWPYPASCAGSTVAGDLGFRLGWPLNEVVQAIESLSGDGFER